MEKPRTTASTESRADHQAFKSKLQEGASRFLAYVVEHSLTSGKRTPEDFIRHFSPKIIMEGLKDEPQLRANILVIATGVRAKVALKKDAASSGADLQIALDEHETDAETVVGLFDPDDRVRFLDHRALWTYVTEGDVWKVEAKKDPALHARAAAHVSYVIDRALEDRLLTHRDVVRGITINAMASYLPRSELPKLIDAALDLGNAKKPFVEKNLLEAIPVATLAQHVPLPAIWNQVVLPFIAEPHGFAARRDVVPASVSRAHDVERSSGAVEALPQVQAAPTPTPAPAPASPAPVEREPMVEPGPSEAGLDLEVDELLGTLGDALPAADAAPAPRKPFRIPTPSRSDSVPPRA